jgi:hypothetical protein
LRWYAKLLLKLSTLNSKLTRRRACSRLFRRCRQALRVLSRGIMAVFLYKLGTLRWRHLGKSRRLLSLVYRLGRVYGIWRGNPHCVKDIWRNRLANGIDQISVILRRLNLLHSLSEHRAALLKLLLIDIYEFGFLLCRISHRTGLGSLIPQFGNPGLRITCERLRIGRQ